MLDPDPDSMNPDPQHWIYPIDDCNLYPTGGESLGVVRSMSSASYSAFQTDL
jgi:hypothetical protein